MKTGTEPGAVGPDRGLPPVAYRVVANRSETADVVTLSLVPHTTALPAPAPGQFNMLWAPGLGDVPISTSSVLDPGTLVHTVRDVGTVTHSICEVKPGDLLGIRGPFGRGWDLDQARGKDLVLVAGGIGLAPLRPAVHAVLADRAAFGTVYLIVGARDAGQLPFRRELDDWWRQRRITVRTIVDRATTGWRGNVGVVTKELHRVEIDPANAVAMICGPEIMIRIVATQLAAAGIPDQAVQVSLERDMQCGIGRCGHCQLADIFVCRDGPVVGWDVARPLLAVKEL